MDKEELRAMVRLQLEREVQQGRYKFIRDPTLDGRVNTQRAEALIRAGVLTSANCPQLLPPPNMPRITSSNYAYFNKTLLNDIDLRAEEQRWHLKFQPAGGQAMRSKGASRASDGCAWECMCAQTTTLLCFR